MLHSEPDILWDDILPKDKIINCQYLYFWSLHTGIFFMYPDPTKNKLNQKNTYIINVVNEHSRWETMHNRRKSLTYVIVDFVFNQVYISKPPCLNDIVLKLLSPIGSYWTCRQVKEN